MGLLDPSDLIPGEINYEIEMEQCNMEQIEKDLSEGGDGLSLAQEKWLFEEAKRLKAELLSGKQCCSLICFADRLQMHEKIKRLEGAGK